MIAPNQTPFTVHTSYLYSDLAISLIPRTGATPAFGLTKKPPVRANQTTLGYCMTGKANLMARELSRIEDLRSRRAAIVF